MTEMEAAYSIACWDDGSGVVESEEVICGMDNDGAILVENEEFEEGVCEEVVVQGENQGDVMYISNDDMIVMQQQQSEVSVQVPSDYLLVCVGCRCINPTCNE